MKGISVVVSTYNRVELLKKCTDSLLAQTFGEYEIIIINDASSDGTAEYLNSLHNPKIRIIHHETNQGLCPSRNDGIKEASFDLVCFTDDDCVADKEWLNEISKHTSAQFDFGAGQTFFVRENYRSFFPERGAATTNIGALWPKGNNLIFRREVLEKIGMFDKFFDQYNNDDSEIGIRALNSGFKFTPIPSAVVYHQRTLWTRKALWGSAKNPAVWVVLKKKYPQEYGYFQPPVYAGIFINPEDYLQIILMPILLPLLFVRYVISGRGDIGLFFAKWPWYPFLRRYYIYKEAWKQRVPAL